MQRFVFKLEAVRKLRKQQEEAVQVELARVMRERNAVLQDLIASRDAEQDLFTYLREPGRTAAEMAHVSRYGTWHRQQIFSLGIKLMQFDKGVELVRTRLVDARARREALDRLHDKQREAWRLAAQREEQNELDEIATMRAARGLGAVA
ncbi:MAG: Flagellar FliJ protein [Thermoleophilia bacterium]|nr:Flagellar FliJ protein [Thermoleophilia bacterium]